MVLLVGWIDPSAGRAYLCACLYLCMFLQDWGRQRLQCCMQVQLGHDAKDNNWGGAKEMSSSYLEVWSRVDSAGRFAGVQVTSLLGRVRSVQVRCSNANRGDDG